MGYSTDRAITTIEDDMLGRAPFAKRLGKTIYEYTEIESLVIGLYGKWGCGKTSVANMALQEIEILSNESEKKPLIIRFSPWNYSDKDNLISQFLNTLKTRIDGKDGEKIKSVIGNALSDYSDAFDLVSFLPGVGVALTPILKKLAQISGEMLTKPIDLDTSKKALEDLLKEADQKIIVLIDDII